MANNDLEKYAKALEKCVQPLSFYLPQCLSYLSSAIMKYHTLKMEEVNDTMRHLWNKTYQGTGEFLASEEPPTCSLMLMFDLKISTGLRFGPMLKVESPNVPITIECVLSFTSLMVPLTPIKGCDDERPS